MMELVSKVFDPKDRRFMALVVEPELFGDLFLNLGKIKVTGLPHDVKVQAMVYDPMRGVVVLRLWSSEFGVIDTGAAIPVCDGVRIERVSGEDDQKPASASASEVNKCRYFHNAEFARLVTRFNGEDGLIYSKNGCMSKASYGLAWHEQNKKEIELTESEAVGILGGRPWEDKK